MQANNYGPDLDRLLALTPTMFEEEVAALLHDRGYQGVIRVGRAGDLGVDVRCRDKHGRLVVAQCKRYVPTNPITGPDIQRFFGMVVHHGAARGICVTTSRFTRSAIALANERDIELVDGASLARHYAARRAVQARQQGSAGPSHQPTTSPIEFPTFGHPGVRQFISVVGIGLLLLCVLVVAVGSDDEEPTPRRPVVARPATATFNARPTWTPAPTPTTPASPTKVDVLVTSGVEFRVVGARLAPASDPPGTLPMLTDGRRYLLVSVHVRNNSDGGKTLDSDDFYVSVEGTKVKEAGDVVDAVAEDVGLKSMGDMIGTRLDKGEARTFLFVYKVPPAARSYLMRLPPAGGRYVNLAPYLGEQVEERMLVPTGTAVPAST